MLAGARAQGVSVTQDQYVYTASSTGVSQLLPDSSREGGSEKFAARINDPAQRAKIVAQMTNSLARGGHDGYDYVTIASCRHDPGINGLTLPEAAKLRKGSAAVEKQIELVFDLELNGRTTAVFFDERDGLAGVLAAHEHDGRIRQRRAEISRRRAASARLRQQRPRARPLRARAEIIVRRGSRAPHDFAAGGDLSAR